MGFLLRFDQRVLTIQATRGNRLHELQVAIGFSELKTIVFSKIRTELIKQFFFFYKYCERIKIYF